MPVASHWPQAQAGSDVWLPIQTNSFSHLSYHRAVVWYYMSQILGPFWQWVTSEKFLISLEVSQVHFSVFPQTPTNSSPLSISLWLFQKMLLTRPDHHKKHPPCWSTLRPIHRNTLVSSSVSLNFATVYFKMSLMFLTLISSFDIFGPKMANAQVTEGIALALSGIVALITVFSLSHVLSFTCLLPYNPYWFRHGHGLCVRLDRLNRAIVHGVHTVFVKDLNHNILSVCDYAF